MVGADSFCALGEMLDSGSRTATAAEREAGISPYLHARYPEALRRLR